MLSYNQYHKKGAKARVRKSAVVIAVLVVLIGAAAVFLAVKSTGKNKALPSSEQVSSSSVVSSNVESSSNESSAPAVNVKTTKTVPVLMYHSIVYQKNNILRIPKEKFEAQMKWLKDNGYTTMTMNEAYEAVSNKKEIPEKSVLITFDDGYIDNYENAFPIMKKYNLKGTVFMITSKINDDKDGYLTADMLKKMDKGGMEIESHTVTHTDLDTLSYSKQLNELKTSKSTLEALLGKNVDFLAFPTGKYNENTIKAAKEAGYKMCFKMKGGQGTISDNIYKFPRFFIGEDFKDFISRVEGTAQYSK